ncbi:GNAT family N-acetyltransferase, partial [Capnocytophaga sp. oral taxon 329]
MFKDLSFLLLTEDHTIKPFDCEDEDLNDFLFKEAILYQKQMLATTFIVENNERTLGFYSVLSDSLQIREELFPSKSQYKKFVQNLIPHRKRHLKNIPSLKIGRLGIDKTYKGKGLGSILLEGIINEAIELNKR